MKHVKVKQLVSIQSGNPIANQFEIYTNKGYYFQSYNSIIYFKCSKTGKKYLDKYKWDYSNTTGKYRNQILCEGIAETREKIKRKEYILKDLN
tara:strand:- start:326 stop:604 length:279 start_codon:yes stop_codon:yes gene_type:complete